MSLGERSDLMVICIIQIFFIFHILDSCSHRNSFHSKIIIYIVISPKQIFMKDFLHQMFVLCWLWDILKTDRFIGVLIKLKTNKLLFRAWWLLNLLSGQANTATCQSCQLQLWSGLTIFNNPSLRLAWTRMSCILKVLC